MKTAIQRALSTVIAKYPDTVVEQVKGKGTRSLRAAMRRNIPRIGFELEAICERVPRGGTVADIGGGISLFAPGAALLGYQSILVDDFRDRWHEAASNVLTEQERLGVQVLSCDILNDPLPFEPESLDAVTSFDCIEHLASSPKPLFTGLMRSLKPGGVFFLGVPNCVNLRKRITVPLGIGKWSQMSEWYEEEMFRGHVREPDVADLRYIASDLGLQDVEILGRNWLGYTSQYAFARALVPYADWLLQRRPSLCSNIYLIGRKQ